MCGGALKAVLLQGGIRNTIDRVSVRGRECMLPVLCRLMSHWCCSVQGFGAGNFKSLFEAIERDMFDRGTSVEMPQKK